MEGLGAACDVLNIGNPVLRTPREASRLVLSLEGCRCALEKRSFYPLERVDANYCVGTTFNLAGDDWDDATPGTDMELSSLRAEAVLRYERWIAYSDLERTRVA